MKPDLATLARDLERYEGRRRTVYRCPQGKLTIGVGRNLEDVGLSDEEIRVLLRNDISRIVVEAQREPWWPAVADDDVRARALLDMLFNLGLTRLRGFRKMLAAVQGRDWETAARELEDSQYFWQVGRRARDNQYRIRYGRDPE